MTLTAERVVTVSWPQIRSLIRTQLLAGDVSFRSAYHETVRARTPHGVDTDTRCTLWDALVAISVLPRMERDLIRRDVGYHCVEAKCKRKPGRFASWDVGHWHSQGFGHWKWQEGMSVKRLRDILEEARKRIEEACS